jgi:hypothetical protein
MQNSALDPDAIAMASKAYEQACDALGLVERQDPLTEVVAKKVLEVLQYGYHDAAQISARVVRELGPQNTVQGS